MKKTLLACCMLILFVASCGGGTKTASPGLETEPSPTAVPSTAPIELGTDYPAPAEIGPETAYPVMEPTPKKRMIITDTPDVLRSPVIISDVIKTADEERIILRNVTQQDQDITLFSILQVASAEHFNIPEYRLAPGATVMIYNGPGEISQEEGFKWMGQPLLVESGDQYSLLNRAGRLIWAYVYYP